MHHMNTEHSKPRRILLAVTGLTPQVLTETLCALACVPNDPWIPDEIHVITTATGAENVRLNLLVGQAWFYRLLQDYALPNIAFPAENIHVLKDDLGQKMDDIRTPAQNTQAANFITEAVRRLTQDPQSELHISIAGGRKTMGYYLGYALSLFGRPQDRLSHVLVNDPFESNREFYYPTPYDHPVHNERSKTTVNARDAVVELADIPFVRLRDGLPAELLKGRAQFSEVVSAAQCTGRKIELVIDLANRTATASGENLKLTNQAFALLAWMAKRRKSSTLPVYCSSKQGNKEVVSELLNVYQHLFGAFSADYETAEKPLKHGLYNNWFSPAKNRLHKALTTALGENGAAPYMIRQVGKRTAALFELTLDPHAITILE